jgi:peptidyl-tRNA hydrolase, PTH2 family
MKEIKQVIVMRNDLKMSKEKMVAQGSHASMKVFFDMIHKKRITDGDHIIYEMYLPGNEKGQDIGTWIECLFTKRIRSVASEEELLTIYNKAKKEELPCALIQDAGKTEFNRVPTYTCCAIGPADIKLIDSVTGDIPLL